MRAIFIATIITGLVLITQAGGVRWGSDSQAALSADTDILELSQKTQPEMTRPVSSDSVNVLMGALYNYTFAPLVNSILGCAQAQVASSSDVRDADEVYVATTHPSFDASRRVNNKAPGTVEDTEEGWNIVPEPSTAILALVGATALLLRRRRM